VAGAGLIYYTTTVGPSSTYNSSLGPATNVNATGTSYWNGSVYFPDVMRNPFNVSVGTIIASTAAAPTFNCEYSFDDYTLPTYTASAATWFVLSGISSAAANATGNIAFPVRAIRLNVTSGSPQQTVQMCIIQAAGD